MFAVFLEVIVIDFDTEHNSTGHGSNDIGDEQGPVSEHQSLDGKEDATQSCHQEGGKGNSIGIMGADGINRLGHVAQHQADGPGVADNVGQVSRDKFQHNNQLSV